jgi:hypothetical protein
MVRCVSRLSYRLCLSALALFVVAGSVNPQSVSTTTGRWVWKQIALKNKSQTQFTLVIKREGNVLRGIYSVDEFIDGEWQGEDGNQTPFIGRITDEGFEIEFDPAATVPGYQQNVTYKPPTDGRKPNLAVLRLKGETLHWRLVRGRIERVPARITLHRERRPR